MELETYKAEKKQAEVGKSKNEVHQTIISKLEEQVADANSQIEKQ